MRRTSIAWGSLALLAGAAAACRDARRDEGGVAAPPVLETLEGFPPPAAPAPAPAADPVARARPVPKQRVRPPLAAAVAAPAPAVSLEKLLQVPPYTIARPAELDIDELLRAAIAAELAGEAESGDDDAKRSRRLSLDVDLRTDSPIVRPDLKREQLDAAARLDVSKDTSIKGGVRIERDSTGGIESNRNTTPTIGIEKRF